MGVWAKKTLFGKRKNVIPARTRPLVNEDHFLVAWTAQPSFIGHGPKLRALILAIGLWPKMAKIRDEPWKMTPTSEAEIF